MFLLLIFKKVLFSLLLAKKCFLRHFARKKGIQKDKKKKLQSHSYKLFTVAIASRRDLHVDAGAARANATLSQLSFCLIKYGRFFAKQKIGFFVCCFFCN